MSNFKRVYFLFITASIVTGLPAIYFAYMQAQENNIIDHYLSINNLYNLPVSKKTALHVSDWVRSDFNVNEKSFTILEMSNRPFLREDTGFLLTHKEGLCGEGTRVIVNLLSQLGFDATRITLFNKELQSAHTLISVVIDNHEFFIDSINTGNKTNDFLRNTNVSPSNFNLLHYSDNLVERREFKKIDNGEKSEAYIKFFDYYWLYSYEATPYSKLLIKLGFDVRVFNFDRPPRWVSVLAEKPNMVLFFTAILFWVICIYLLYMVKNYYLLHAGK